MAQGPASQRGQGRTVVGCQPREAGPPLLRGALGQSWPRSGSQHNNCKNWQCGLDLIQSFIWHGNCGSILPSYSKTLLLCFVFHLKWFEPPFSPFQIFIRICRCEILAHQAPVRAPINGLTKRLPYATTWRMTKPRAAKAVLARPATAAPKNASKSTSFFPGIGLILLRVFSTLSGVATAAPLRQLG